MILRRWLVGAAALAAVVATLLAVRGLTRDHGAAASSSAPLPPPKATPAAASILPADFVGAEACAGCHAREAESWRASTHAAAGGVAGRVRVIAPFDGTPIRFSDAEVIPRSSGGRPSFVVRQTGARDIVLSVDAVIGGGHMQGGGTQGFLTRHADGTWRFLPFDFSRQGATWFCNTIGRGARGWVPITPALSITSCVDWPPARVLGDTPRFSNCQSCHGSQIVLTLDTVAQAYRTSFTSLAVNCESCHGPGRRHLELVRDTAAVARGDIGMTALATLDKDASLGICWRCHALKDQLREGYLPGLPLDAWYSTRLPQLGDAAHFPDGRVRTFAYQQGHLYSDCYVNGGMTCTSCHNPHSQGYRDVTGGPLDGRFDDRQCTGCHASKADSATLHTRHPAGSPGSRCTSCHMPYLQEPELGTAIPYARADHAIPIPRPAFDASFGIASACRSCHSGESEAALDARVQEWYGPLKPHARAIDALARAGDASDARATARLLLEPGERHTAALFAGMAWFVERHLRPDDASLHREVVDRLRALAGHTDIDVRALALAALHYARGSDAGVRDFLINTLQTLDAGPEPLIRSRWALVLGFLGDRSRGSGDPLGAIRTYTMAREVDPANPRILVNLALAYADAGNLSAAIDSYQQSLALDPAQPLTLVNLGIAHTRRSDLEQARAAYRRAIALNPREPLAWFNLGGVYLRERNADSAMTSLGRAAELDPSLSLARFYRARLYIERGDAASALREVEAGLRFDPGNAEALALRDRLAGRR